MRRIVLMAAVVQSLATLSITAQPTLASIYYVDGMDLGVKRADNDGNNIEHLFSLQSLLPAAWDRDGAIHVDLRSQTIGTDQLNVATFDRLEVATILFRLAC